MTNKERGSHTKKYFNRRNAIVETASAILNRKGLKGMTLADVGEPFGMVATGVAYYFPSKEALSAACFNRSIDIFNTLTEQAALRNKVEDRLQTLIRGYFNLRQLIAEGKESAFAQFDDVRALGDQNIMNSYVHMFRNMRELLAPLLKHGMKRSAFNTRIHMLIQQFLWMEAWLYKHDPDDYSRVADRFIDIFLNGLKGETTEWHPELITLDHPNRSNSDDEPYQIFLRAATELINEFGYHGASVEKIAAKLEVTKGSFYHHIDAKDDLVAICFSRTTDVVRNTQRAAGLLPVNGYNKLASALTSLVQHQLEGEVPLLRAATVSLPEGIRKDVLTEYEHNAVRFSSMLSDSMLDGSVRIVDTQLAAHMINGVANGIGELVYWLPRPFDTKAGESYVRPLFEGFLTGLNPD